MTGWLLRGYIINTEDKSIQRIEEEISLKEIEGLKISKKKMSLKNEGR